MPRRPSASVGPSLSSHTTTPNSSSILVHRTTESHSHVFASVPSSVQHHSLQTLGSSATPQQKIVQVLVNRLKHKLPCNSGLSLDRVEADRPTQQAIETLVTLSSDSLDMIAWALCELLDRLAKQQSDMHSGGHPAIDVLQSQLFILKVLSMTMASRWSPGPQRASDDLPSSLPDSPVHPGSSSTNGHRSKSPLEQSANSTWQEPPPLDDSCVKYILSVMVLFMRQTALTGDPSLMLQTRSTDIAFRDFEDNVNLASPSADTPSSTPEPPSPPPSNTRLRPQPSSTSVRSSRVNIKSSVQIPAVVTAYEKTHMSLVKSSLSVNNLIAKYVGRIIFHISASNWNVVFERLSTKITYLAQHIDSAPDVVDLQLISHSALDRTRLVTLLNQLSSLMVNMRKEAQFAITIHLRAAVWNWIEIFPSEFNEAIRTRGKMEGAPERVFDLLYSLIPSNGGLEKVFWPTLMILNCITSDRITADFQIGQVVPKGRKELKFLDTVIKNVGNHSKLSEIALACVVDLCRAAAYIEPGGPDVPLRIVAADIAHEIKSLLFQCAPGRKPFWESQDDIDVSLYADALVAVFRFLPLQESSPLFEACIEPERSEATKTCVIRAFLTLVQDAARFYWQRPPAELEDTIAMSCREILKTAGVRRQEIERNGVMRRVATRPRAKRSFPEPLSEREVLILGILSLWRAYPVFFMKGIRTMQEVEDWVMIAVKLWEAPIDISVKISTAFCMRKVSESTFMMPPTDDNHAMMVNIVKSSLPVTLLSVVGNLLTTRVDLDAQRLWISIAHQVLEVYVTKTDLQHVKELQVDPRRVPALALAEVSFLVALTSADNDISELAARGLRVVAHAERWPGAPVNTAISEEDRSKRNPIYEALGDPRITIPGRLGHQKRIRKLARQLTFSIGIHVVVWEECYWRWRALNEVINDAINEAIEGGEPLLGHVPLAQQEVRNQWQNLTLFLAALGGTCVQEGQDLTTLSKVIPARYLPDKMRVVGDPRPLLENFIHDLVNLLVAGDVQIRDIVRDALGSELSPRLYSRLIATFQKSLEALEERAGPSDFERYAVILDQVTGILKLIADNKDVTLEDIMNADISPTLLYLTSIIGRFSGPGVNRIKIKFCSLCESVCSRTDTLGLRKDSPVRHELLNYVLQWMSPVRNVADPTILNELNMACLRAAVKLLERLELKVQEPSNTADDSLHVVSRLFNKYSTALLASIESIEGGNNDGLTSDSVSELGSLHQKMKLSQKEAELHELVITGLTHLVSANSESGFKQCLPLAYDLDNRKRTIFAHVFARVIGQGTVFDPEDKTAVKSRHAALCELVRGSDLILALTICEICPQNEVEMMISVLLNVFDTRTSLMSLMKLMIEREVAETDSDTSLFRGNSTCTRFLSAFAKVHGYHYLRSLVQPLVDTMASMPPGTGYEIDPSKAAPADVAVNKENVELVASTFIELMSSSLPALPGMFREICAHIAKVVNERWPDSKFAAMGAFIFLRFISPAVVAPQTVDIEVPKGDQASTIQRGLMIIAKIIQNLANNIFFGKEAYMTTLNKFLEVNIANVTRFLSELHKYSPATDEPNDVWMGITSDESDLVVLHRFFHKHADKIGKELLSLSRPSPEGEASAIAGKRAWDSLCALLVDLGPPMEAPRLSTSDSSMHREYLDLMAKYANRDTSSVAHLFLESDVQEGPAVFILRLASIDVEGLDIELLMYHILKTLSSERYHDLPFDIVLDCTSFTSISEIPLQWLKYCTELIPYDIRARFHATRILNPNGLTQKYLRRLYNISAGTSLCSQIKAYTSVLQLMEDVRSTVLTPLAYPVSLEQENHETFYDVTMRTPMRIPVILRVGTTHIRVTSVKSLPISPGMSCKSTELIPLADVSDIYNVSTGQENNEFIIRRRQGVTVYFSSPSREHVVKHIRSAKGRLREAQAPMTERFSRFSNVPAALLHIGFLSVDVNDEELRGAAYSLLGAVCNYLKYDKSPIIAPRAGFIAGDAVAFVSNLSEKLADFAPQLTLDFIHEVTATMNQEKTGLGQRLVCLQYLSPWIKNLSHFANPTHSLYERSGARLRDCIRTLSDMSYNLREHLTSSIQRHVWMEVAKLDSNIVDIILDELVRTATDGGIGSRRCETISHIVATISSISVRGRVYNKLRKALSKVPPKSANSLEDHPNWTEISTLIRLSLAVGPQTTETGIGYTYVPEVLHLVSIVAGEGPTLVRKSVYGIIVNLLQSLYLSRQDDSKEAALMKLVNDCTLPETMRLFGLCRQTPAGEYTNVDVQNEKDYLDNHERLVAFLVKIRETAAYNIDLDNHWRARWMGLVSSTSFQLSPAVQTRAFVVLAALATAEVDDDFLYQILVAFKGALSKANESNTLAIVSMLRCMCKVVPAIVGTSRYITVLFWLSVALLEASHLGFYIEALWLLRVTLEYMQNRGMFEEYSVQEVLMEAREQVKEVTLQLDEMLRISFETSFSFSLAAIIFKGMRHSGLKDAAEAALRTLLRVTSCAHKGSDVPNGVNHTPRPDALGYFIALLPVSTTKSAYRRLLSEAHINLSVLDGVDGDDEDGGIPCLDPRNLGVQDHNTALLVASFAGTILASAQGDDAETEMLYGLLASLAMTYPDVISVTYETIQERIKETFSISSNASIIRSVSTIFRVALQDPVRSSNASTTTSSTTHAGSTSTLSVVEENGIAHPGRLHLNALEDLGMQGLAHNFQFLPPGKGHSTKMINWIPSLITLMIS